MAVDGKVYTDKEEMKKAIVMVDTGKGLTGKDKVKHETEVVKDEFGKALKRDAPVLRRTATIAVARGAVAAQKEATYGGESILAKLVAFLARTMQAPGR
jgi:hypothetical protein